MTGEFKVTSDSFVDVPVVFSIAAEHDFLEVSHSVEIPARDGAPGLSGRAVVEFRKDRFVLRIEGVGNNDIECIYTPLRGGTYGFEETNFETSLFTDKFDHEIYDAIINAALGAVNKLTREQPKLLTQAQKQLIKSAERFLAPIQSSKPGGP